MAETNSKPQIAQEQKKGAPIGMIALSIILAAALIFLVVMYFDQKNKMVEMKTVLTEEKDSLANELQKMVASYDTLKTDNDTLNANLQREKKENHPVIVNPRLGRTAGKEIQKRDYDNEGYNEKLHNSNRFSQYPE